MEPSGDLGPAGLLECDLLAGEPLGEFGLPDLDLWPLELPGDLGPAGLLECDLLSGEPPGELGLPDLDT